MPPEKKCPKCDRVKPADAFAKRKRRDGTYGLKSWCKECVNATERAKYAADPAPTLARTAAWAKANPEVNRKASREANARRRAERPEELREYQRQYRKANPDRHAEYDRRKRAKNPDLYRELGRKSTATRRARVAGALFEDVDHSAVWAEDKGICHLCGYAADPADWHLDHVVPLAVGGAHSRRNVAVSHPQCNQSKNDRFVPSARGLMGAWTLRPSTCP